MDNLKEVDGVGALYLDFAKAFDKVETNVLLQKLKLGNIKGKVGIWLAAFLDSSNRKQAVRVEGRVSGLSPVISGVPQGTVLGPVLFLLHVSDIDRGVSEGTTTTSYVDDTRVVRPITNNNNNNNDDNNHEDCEQLQLDIQSIYDWAKDVNMLFNCDKFELLRFWPRGKNNNFQYLSPENTPIQEKENLRDLGVQISSDLCFTVHIDNTIAGTNKIIGMLLRSFSRRSRLLMLTTWKTIVQPKLDYCSQLWSPSDQGNIAKLESVLRGFTSKIAGCQHLDYWDRLKYLQLYSQERRRERYMIIYMWKISQGMVKGYDIEFNTNPRRGRLASVPQVRNSAPNSVKKATHSSFHVKGARLFNSIPSLIRDINSNSVDTFKTSLDAYLSIIPDQPTIPDRARAAASNSLLDQIPLVGQY